jgi:hypothetical protein
MKKTYWFLKKQKTTSHNYLGMQLKSEIPQFISCEGHQKGEGKAYNG